MFLAPCAPGAPRETLGSSLLLLPPIGPEHPATASQHSLTEGPLTLVAATQAQGVVPSIRDEDLKVWPGHRVLIGKGVQVVTVGVGIIHHMKVERRPAKVTSKITFRRKM
jgi:hypothetical protein